MPQRKHRLPDDTRPRRRLRKSERQELILVELRMTPHVRTTELAEIFGVTTETIRRDVEELSRLGMLSRSYGGALANHAGGYPDLDARRRENLRERERIARRAAGLVGNGEALMIDAGSTTIHFARALAVAGTAVMAITNSLHVASALAHGGAATVVLCPGEYLPREGAVVGTDTVDFLGRHHVDRAFLGASGFSERGVTEAVPGFAAVKRAMLGQAREAHLLIDSSKFGATYLRFVAGFREFRSIVSDRRPDAALLRRLEAEGTDLIVAP